MNRREVHPDTRYYQAAHLRSEPASSCSGIDEVFKQLYPDPQQQAGNLAVFWAVSSGREYINPWIFHGEDLRICGSPGQLSATRIISRVHEAGAATEATPDDPYRIVFENLLEETEELPPLEANQRIEQEKKLVLSSLETILIARRNIHAYYEAQRNDQPIPANLRTPFGHRHDLRPLDRKIMAYARNVTRSSTASEEIAPEIYGRLRGASFEFWNRVANKKGRGTG